MPIRPSNPQEIFEETIEVYTTPDGWTVLHFRDYEAFLSPDCARSLIKSLQLSDAMSIELIKTADDLNAGFGKA